MYAQSSQDKKRFAHFHISEFNLKLYSNYYDPEIREKKYNNLIFRIRTGTILMVVAIEYIKKGYLNYVILDGLMFRTEVHYS
jgi:hypothetical protein